MADGTPAPPPAPLPVWHSVVLGYIDIARHLSVYLAMAALWSFLVIGGLRLLILAAFGGEPTANDVTALTQELAGWVEYLLGNIGSVLIAVAGYRAVLLGEAPSLHCLSRFGRRELRLFGVYLVYLALNFVLLSAALMVLVGVAGADVAAAIDSNIAIALPFELVAGLLGDLMIAPFLILAFPLAALDARPSLFVGAWRLGRGHRLRLCAVSYLSGLPFMFLTYLPRQLFQPDAEWLAVYLWTSLAGFIGLLWTAFYSGCIALAFDWIMQRQRDRSLTVFD